MSWVSPAAVQPLAGDGGQWPVRIRAREPSAAATSLPSLDFPIPASPRTVRRCPPRRHERLARTRSPRGRARHLFPPSARRNDARAPEPRERGRQVSKARASARRRVRAARAPEDSPSFLTDEHILVCGGALDRCGDVQHLAGHRRPSRAGAADSMLLSSGTSSSASPCASRLAIRALLWRR
jgi:hypothetical protein